MPSLTTTSWVSLWAHSSYATKVKGDNEPDDSNFAIEGYYDFQVTDNITVTQQYSGFRMLMEMRQLTEKYTWCLG